MSAQPSEGNGQENGDTAEPATAASTEATESAAEEVAEASTASAASAASTKPKRGGRKPKKVSAADSTRDEASIKVPLPESDPEPVGFEGGSADGDQGESRASSVVRDSARPAMPSSGSSPGPLPPSGGYSSDNPYGPPTPADGPSRGSGAFGAAPPPSYGRYPATGSGPGHAPGPGHGPAPGHAPPSGTSRHERLAGLAKVAKGAKAEKGRQAASGEKTPRRAHLQLARLEPWSVMKFSFVMSLVCFVVLVVAVTVLYVILSGLGVFDAISSTVNDLTREQGTSQGGLDAGSWFSFSRIFGYTALIGAVNVLLITALSTVGAVIYNMAADLVGGVEVTLKEAE